MGFNQAARFRSFIWPALFVLCVAAFLCFALPLYVIRPFRAQGAGELSLALSVRSWGPYLALACAVLSIPLAILLWNRLARWLPRAGAAALCVGTVAFALLSRVNVYELMFHPAGHPNFVAADKASVDADDMVLSVSISGESHAYPVRAMGYHHVINDWVAGQPIVSTY